MLETETSKVSKAYAYIKPPKAVTRVPCTEIDEELRKDSVGEKAKSERRIDECIKGRTISTSEQSRGRGSEWTSKLLALFCVWGVVVLVRKIGKMCGMRTKAHSYLHILLLIYLAEKHQLCGVLISGSKRKQASSSATTVSTGTNRCMQQQQHQHHHLSASSSSGLLTVSTVESPTLTFVDRLKQRLLLAYDNGDIQEATDVVIKLEKSNLTRELLEWLGVGHVRTCWCRMHSALLIREQQHRTHVYVYHAASRQRALSRLCSSNQERLPRPAALACQPMLLPTDLWDGEELGVACSIEAALAHPYDSNRRDLKMSNRLGGCMFMFL
ncbi:unnamed protein product [Thelazia callipaeda]|uniref:LisH domain-containing protein n=1 Tax=Thelazia callipaeda TaxID=103827 RepID=A0A0N5CM97_THECL|nr:unnamed protein product [Thelazia callipaeda]